MYKKESIFYFSFEYKQQFYLFFLLVNQTTLCKMASRWKSKFTKEHNHNHLLFEAQKQGQHWPDSAGILARISSCALWRSFEFLRDCLVIPFDVLDSVRFQNISLCAPKFAGIKIQIGSLHSFTCSNFIFFNLTLFYVYLKDYINLDLKELCYLRIAIFYNLYFNS